MARKQTDENLKDYEGRSTEDISNDEVGFLEDDEFFQDEDMTGEEGGESVGRKKKDDQNRDDEGTEDDNLL